MNALENLPVPPPELAEFEARRAEMRRQRQEAEARLRDLAEARWRAQQHDPGDLDRAAERALAGDLDPPAVQDLDAEIRAVRARLAVLARAERMAIERVRAVRVEHAAAVARVLRPVHRAVVGKIARALLELEALNAEEQRIRAAVPGGGGLIACNFPNIGSSRPDGGPLHWWLQHARRHGLLDDAESQDAWPAAAE